MSAMILASGSWGRFGLRAALCLLLSLPLVACEQLQPQQGSAQADAIVRQYMTAIKAGKFAQAAAFFPADKRQEWQAFLTDNQQRLGSLGEYSLSGPEMNTVYSGQYFIYIIDADYERRSTHEVVTLFLGLKDSKPHIAFHKITSEKPLIP